MILSKKDLAKYLKYGWVSDYNYPEPKKKNRHVYQELVEELEKKCEESILDCHYSCRNPIYLLSGGVDSSLVVSRAPKPAVTFSIGNWNMDDSPWAQKASDVLKSIHREFNTQSQFYEEDLWRIQSWFDKPYSLLLGFFWFLVAKELGRYGLFHFIDGNGPDHSMMEDHGNEIIIKAATMGQYNYKMGQKYLIESILDDVTQSSHIMLKMLKQEHTIDRYIDALPLNQFRIIFDDDEVEKFGLEPFQLDLREESIDHIDEILFHIKEESANLFYKMIEDVLGCKSYHPLRRNDILEICRETPYEIKNALGYQKLPFRELCLWWVNYEIATRPKTDWVPRIPERRNWMVGDYDFSYPIDLDSFKELVGIYLEHKNKKIYNYLDYNLVKPYFQSQPPGISKFSRQIWNLLNLSIWLECHDDYYAAHRINKQM